MILSCSTCGARYRFDETKLAGDQAVFRCRKCGASIRALRPSASAPPESQLPAPESAPPVRPAAASPRSASSAASARTALLADEAREFREFVRAELQAAGYDVSTTESGQEALLLAGSHPFDLIVLNAYLREMLGIHVCEKIKSNPSLKSTPVILMGALVGPDSVAGGSSNRYGADDFISTSISREDLAARIGRVSRGKGARPASSPPPGRAPAPSLTGGAPAPAIAAGGQPPAAGHKVPTGDEAEIRRLARIMISDIEIYHPEKFKRALRDGTFFEAFAEELSRGKELVDRRFGQLPNRIQLLAAGLRDSVEAYRSGGPPRRASFG
jgi:predicted Zn finger-like uncharacterized protein